MNSSATLTVHDCHPAVDSFAEEVLHGLRQPSKQIPCKFFYDARGSELFDQICDLPEYYLTRCELQIMRQHICEIADTLGPRCSIIEYGSGSSLKTDILLDHLHEPAAYVPIDISRGHLLHAARRLRAKYPRLEILPVCADYTREYTLPDYPDASQPVVYFPGSTIGNFDPREARIFLRKIRQIARALLIGVDLKKDPRILHAAYNDSAGVTANFNLNLLDRINRELDGSFNCSRFGHYAFYNPQMARIEMHLVSLESQFARAAGECFGIADGESIFTESSYKYSLGDFRSLAADAGFNVQRVWTDDDGHFSVQYLE